MAMRSLPTGEEPPKGYETLVKLNAIADSLQVDFVLLSALARTERAEVEHLRAKSLEYVKTFVGLTNEPVTFERETSLIPGKEATDKMLVRTYLGKQLVGYALVIIGWPEKCQWLIQHMIIDPEQRDKGIGSVIVENIERFAVESDVDASSIFAIPIQKSGVDFWANHGYTVESSRQLVTVADVDHEVIVYHKALS
jgi:GNAT superfamily N-acetyltransferase